ncbi:MULTISPECIES: hypothetical protein [Paenibacillus]|uniref:hypothetical protein n=1 Tax=Paenibacillus TaxID=44249 RepID=UPI0022B8BC5F|nr:hypothetical protein [Paenibacillus caseinilyticus]MCZ8519852.1 hypothetical protein [Paenibacillus caseinilyticus]
MKISKVLAVSLCALTLSTSVVSAAPTAGSSTYDENFVAARIYNKPKPNVITPMFDGYVYNKTSETVRNQENWSLEHNNPSSVTDTVSYAVAITKSASTTFGAQEEFNGLVAKATFSANVTLAQSSTETVTITWSIPQGNWRLSAGSKYNKVVGSKDYMISGQLINRQPITIDYSYQPYSDKRQI